MPNLGYLAYNLAAALAGPLYIGLAAARGRLRGHWRERFGLAGGADWTGSPRIWVHAVSVGEIQAALAVVKALKARAPDAAVWLSVTTDTGRSAAEEAMAGVCPVITFPFDIFGSPGRALDRLRPDLAVLLETELWPNFLKAAGRRGVRTMLANGRISPRSVGRYQKAGFLFRDVLGRLDRMAMIRWEDAERIVSIGADPDRVRVVGNAKYDLLTRRADASRVERLRGELALPVGAPVLIAGSTRESEESLVLEAFQMLRRDFPELHLILVPRHPTRAEEVAALILNRGFSCRRRSAGPPTGDLTDVTLVDVVGELFSLYGLSDVAFCGGSLAPFGGQNPLEPAVWGVPVLYGPSMDDFLDARDMLETAGAGGRVDGAAGLAEAAGRLLADPNLAARKGRAAREALENHRGAADRLAEMALDLLADRRGV